MGEGRANGLVTLQNRVDRLGLFGEKTFAQRLEGAERVSPVDV